MSKKHKISKSRKKELENEVTETVRKFKEDGIFYYRKKIR